MHTKLYLPINLSLENKKCLVAGAGEVAQRKIRSLRSAGAKVFVVAKDIAPNIKKLAAQKKITLSRRNFLNRDLTGKFLVIAATNNQRINQKIAQNARRRHTLVNVVDSLAGSDFIFPAYFRRGGLVISVSSSGASPAFAQKIKNDLKKSFGKEYKTCLSQISGLRKKIIRLFPTGKARKKLLKKLVEF